MDFADLVAAVIRALLRERLVHFAVLGSVIFALAPRAPDPAQISLSTSYLAALRQAQAQRLGVAALSDERTSEVDRRAIEDEVLYREALRLGLDRGDPTVRRHLVQKMLVLAEDLSGASREPTRDELEAYFARTRERWHVADRVHLIHVFAARREQLLALPLAADAEAPPPVGDPFPHSRDVHAGRDDLAASYGEPFADAVMQLAPGTWSAPIASRFGWHLVKVLVREPGRPATFDEAVARVRLEYAVERRHAAIAQYLTKAFARYTVDIDGTAVRDYAPTPRVALRTLPSAED